MKKILISILILFSAFVAAQDPRDYIIGRYFCNVTSTKPSRDHLSLQSCKDTCSIFISKDAIDSLVVVIIKEKQIRASYHNGILQPAYNYQRVIGKFLSNDSLRMTIYNGLGSGPINYSGYKIF
jgi:hypothetical protein